MDFADAAGKFVPELAENPRIFTAGRAYEILRIRFPNTSVNVPLAALAAWGASTDILARFIIWLLGSTDGLVVDLPLDEEEVERGPLIVAPKEVSSGPASTMARALLRASEPMRLWMVVREL
jgi:hypothetical protein